MFFNVNSSPWTEFTAWKHHEDIFANICAMKPQCTSDHHYYTHPLLALLTSLDWPMMICHTVSLSNLTQSPPRIHFIIKLNNQSFTKLARTHASSITLRIVNKSISYDVWIIFAIYKKIYNLEKIWMVAKISPILILLITQAHAWRTGHHASCSGIYVVVTHFIGIRFRRRWRNICSSLLAPPNNLISDRQKRSRTPGIKLWKKYCTTLYKIACRFRCDNG